jgi:hypothetical protein
LCGKEGFFVQVEVVMIEEQERREMRKKRKDAHFHM